MLVSKLSHETDWVKTGILCEGVWDKLKALTELSHAVGVGTEDFSRVSLKFLGNFHLNSGSSWDEESLLNKSSNNTKGIMEGSLGLLEHKLVGSSNEDRDSLVLNWASSDLDDLLVRSSGSLLNKRSRSEFILGELIDMWNWDGVDSLANEVHIFSVDVLDDHNTLLGEEMESQVINSISEDGLLDKQNIASSSNNFLDEVDNILLLLLQDSVHCGIVVHDNVVLEIGLWGGHAELNHTNLGISNSGWATSEVGNLVLSEAESINKL